MTHAMTRGCNLYFFYFKDKDGMELFCVEACSELEAAGTKLERMDISGDGEIEGLDLRGRKGLEELIGYFTALPFDPTPGIDLGQVHQFGFFRQLKGYNTKDPL
jgi:hypothetical protein